jgi:hypothetical protein
MTHLIRILIRAAAITIVSATSLAHAQAATAASALAPAATPIDAEKQKLIDQVLALWHPENVMVVMVQRPAVEAMEKSRIALQQARLPSDKIDKTLKDITVDVQKYVDASSPLTSNAAKKSLPTTAVPLLAQNFSTEELRQLVAMLQSPVKTKFEKLIPQVDQAIGKKVQDEVGPEVNKNIQALTEAVGTKLRIAITAK